MKAFFSAVVFAVVFAGGAAYVLDQYVSKGATQAFGTNGTRPG